MYQMRKFFINLSELFMNAFYPFYESPAPPPPKEEEDMDDLTLPLSDCDCLEEGWKTVLELLNNEDLIWLLFISGFFATFFLWLVTAWLQKRQKKADNRPYKSYKIIKSYKIRRTRNIPSVASDLRSEDEIVIKGKEDTEADCPEKEQVTPANLIMGDRGDRIDGRPFSYENPQNLPRSFQPDGQLPEQISNSAEIFTNSRISEKDAKKVSQLPPTIVSEEKKIKEEITISESKSPIRSETSSLKSRTSKSCSLRVDPLEYRKKHQKKSPLDLNVAFGSRLSTPRIGDFSCQVSPAITPPICSPTRSLANFSANHTSLGKRPDEEKGNFQNENVSQNSSTSSGKSIE